MDNKLQTNTTSIYFPHSSSIHNSTDTNSRDNDEQIQLMVSYMSLDGRLLKVPRSLSNLLGYTENEILTLSYTDITSPEDVNIYKEQCNRLKNNEYKSFEIEKRYIAKNGQKIWVYQNCSLVTNEKNEPQHFVLYIKDITKRKNIELELYSTHNMLERQVDESASKLKEMDDRFRKIFESANEGIWQIDNNGNTILINPEMCKMLGYSEDEMIGRKVIEFVNKDDVEQIKQRIEMNLEGMNEKFDFRFKKKNGDILYVYGCTNPIYNNENQVIGALGLFSDISEKKKLENDLINQQNELIDFIENAPIGLHWVDEKGVIIWANKYEMDLLGYEQDEYIGQHISKFYADKDFIDVILRKSNNNETLNNLNTRLTRKDGSVKYVTISSNVYRKDGQFIHIRCFTKDITEQKLYELKTLEHQKTLHEIERKSRVEFMRLLQRLPAGAYTCNAEGLITWYNENAVAIWGRKPRINDPIDRYSGSYKIYINNAMIPQEHSWMAVCLKEKKEINGEEITFENYDGIRKDCLAYCNPLYDETGKFMGAVNVLVDISSRKTAEVQRNIQYTVAKALAESDTFYEASNKVLKSICEGLGWDIGNIWVLDKVSGHLYNDCSWIKDDITYSIDPEVTSKEIRIKKGDALPGIAWQKKKPVWMMESVLKKMKRGNAIIKSGILTGLAFPVVSGKEVIAIIECFSKKIIPQNDDLIDVLKASGRQIGNYLTRRKAEEEREVAQRMYQSLFETTLDGILVVDDNGKYINVNESYCKILKASKDELIGQDFSKFMPPDYLDKAAKAFEELKVNGYFKGEFPLLAIDGSIVQAEWVSKSNFMPGLHFCVARDISDKLIAEKKLKEEYHLRYAIENSIASGIAVINESGEQVYVNPEFCKMLGYNEDELLGAYPPYCYWPENELESINNAFELTIKGQAPLDGFELKFKNKIGKLIDVLVKVTPLTDENDITKGWLASVTDITSIKKIQSELEASHTKLEDRVEERTNELNMIIKELQREINIRKTAEKNLKKTRDELIDSEKLASLGRFSSGIAHEIRNPLANISTLSQLLAQEKKLDPKLRKYASYIFKNSQIANKIIKDLLSYASSHNVNMVKTDLNAMLHIICDMIAPTCDKNKIKLVKNINLHNSEININQEKLHSALFNIITNSIEAMPDGGTLTISAENNESSGIKITINDSGIGIPENHIKKITEPFYTTKKTGTGLGLSLSYQVIKAHYGSMEIKSKINEGTKVIITLPNNI